MGYLKELLSQVASSLFHNKLRSILTMAGIAWGMASIVLIVAMGDGFKQGQRNNTKQLGENIVLLFAGRTEKQVGGQRAGRRIRFTYDDIDDIRAECYLVSRVIGELQNGAKVASAYNSGSFTVNGVEPLYSKIRTIPIAQGRFLIEPDETDAQRVAVLGDNVRKQLFGDRNTALGVNIFLNGLPFRIVGLMPSKNQNSSYNGLDGDKIYVPYSAMVRDLPPKDDNFHPGIVNDIIYVPSSLTHWKAARQQVLRVLGRNHQFDTDDKGAVYIWDTVESAELVDQIFVSMTAFLGAIAVITLTLGGVGVLNIMLVSVTERTREIGLRKAIGATRRRIMMDFLTEGVMLAGLSGVVGFMGAYGLASLVNLLPQSDMFAGLPVKGATTAWSFGALAVVAIASAVFPAWRAASLTPVEALRDER
ncbi:MAG TPA: ABC transporter permease [Bryobacteraceae bacterium]|jgi:putative ABC transport system permease protein|nr:ABC transporter permease [Bryobacteraceae bacterium]